MSNILARFIKGITLPSQSSDPAEVEEGSLYSVSNPSPRIKAYIQSAAREVITNTQSQTLQNKLIIASENTIQVAATGVTATELNSALQEIQSNFSGKANTNLDNIVTTSIPAGANLESSNISTSSSFKVGTKNQTTSSSGSVDLVTGNAPSSFRSGNLNIYTGSKVSATSSTTGSMSISTGTASGVDRATSSVSSGVLNITTGGVSASNSGSGSILLKSGLVSNSDSNSGAVTIGTGNVSNSIGVSGKLTLETGMAFGDGSCTTTGNIELRTGSNGDQKSGDIILSPGLAGTDEGTIYLGGKEINVTSRKITNLADGTASSDAVNFSQLDKKAEGSAQLTAGENILLNDLVYISSGTGNDSGRTAGRIYKADASNDDRAEILGFAAENINSGSAGKIKTSGHVATLSGLIPGKVYYASASTPGVITDTPPSSNGQWVIAIGLALSSTELIINPVASSTAIYVVDSDVSFTIANNQISPSDVTALLFDGVITRGFILDYSIYRKTDTALSAVSQIGELRGTFNTQNLTWYIANNSYGQNSGVTFSIQPSGQIQYTSTDISGTNYTGTMKYTVRKSFGV